MKKLVISLGMLLGVLLIFEPVYADAEEISGNLFRQACSQCHLLNRVFSKTKTKSRWKRTVARMQKKLKAIDTEIWEKPIYIDEQSASQIVAYLYSEHGYTNSKKSTVTAAGKREKFREKFATSGFKTSEDRRKKLLEKFAKSKARVSKTDERRKKLLGKFTPTKASELTVEERRKRLAGKFTSSTATAEARRKKLLEKFTPTKASELTVEERRKRLAGKFTPAQVTAEERSRRARDKFSVSKARTKPVDGRKRFRQKLRLGTHGVPESE